MVSPMRRGLKLQVREPMLSDGPEVGMVSPMRRGLKLALLPLGRSGKQQLEWSPR